MRRRGRVSCQIGADPCINRLCIMQSSEGGFHEMVNRPWRLARGRGARVLRSGDRAGQNVPDYPTRPIRWSLRHLPAPGDMMARAAPRC